MFQNKVPRRVITSCCYTHHCSWVFKLTQFAIGVGGRCTFFNDILHFLCVITQFLFQFCQTIFISNSYYYYYYLDILHVHRQIFSPKPTARKILNILNSFAQSEFLPWSFYSYQEVLAISKWQCSRERFSTDHSANFDLHVTLSECECKI